MTKLSEVLDADDLAAEIEDGYVKANRHPSLPLTIYTYSRECQYEGRWNAITSLCRGLIADDNGYVIARPFPKFFNYGEHGVRDYAPPLPWEPFRVYSKMDGSLGIVFNYEGQWLAASKGSFISEQARWAQNRIDARSSSMEFLDPDLTYCAEIIYPENRIVVDYGDMEDLMLLAVFHTDGTEDELDDSEPTWPLGDVVMSHGGNWAPDEMARLQQRCDDNSSVTPTAVSYGGTDAEGYVVRFASSVRAKIKYAEYVRLHRLLTGVTERDIWRACAYDDMAKSDMNIDALVRALKCSPDEVRGMQAAPLSALATIVDGCPDEFDAWVQKVVDRLIHEYNTVSDAIQMTFDEVRTHVTTDDRGEFARTLQGGWGHAKTIVSACFAILDDKPTAPLIWRSLYPAASTPFKEDEDS